MPAPITMNSPPASIQRREAEPEAEPQPKAQPPPGSPQTKTTSTSRPSSPSSSSKSPPTAKSPTATITAITKSPTPTKPPKLKSPIISNKAPRCCFGPPSPASTTSAIAVASAHDVSLIQSVQRSDFAPETSDDTRSLTDSIRQHVIDGGLRYHAYHAGQYLFPNDENEQIREELKHNLTVYLCEGKLVYAPVLDILEAGAEVLDLGTGIGKWCIDLADNYPNSEFHGMDLSPIQPDWVPENAIFVVDDIEHEAGWTYPENKFDYIHIRHTVHSIRNRKELWDRIYRHLKPGGYVEIQEFHYTPACDDTSCEGPYAWRDFLRYLRDGMAALGTDMHGIIHVEDELNAAGFQDIRRTSLKCPVGPWPKKPRLQECGHLLRDVIMWGLIGLSRRPFRDGLHWTTLQIEMFLVEVRKSLSEEVNGVPKYHSYFPFHTLYGRKPMSPTEGPGEKKEEEKP